MFASVTAYRLPPAGMGAILPPERYRAAARGSGQRGGPAGTWLIFLSRRERTRLLIIK